MKIDFSDLRAYQGAFSKNSLLITLNEKVFIEKPSIFWNEKNLASSIIFIRIDSPKPEKKRIFFNFVK